MSFRPIYEGWDFKGRLSRRVRSAFAGIGLNRDIGKAAGLIDTITDKLEARGLSTAEGRLAYAIRIADAAIERFDGSGSNSPFADHVAALVDDLINYEGWFALPQEDYLRDLSRSNLWELEDHLKRVEAIIDNLERTAEIASLFLTSLIEPLVTHYPQLLSGQPTHEGTLQFSVGLQDLVTDLPRMVESWIQIPFAPELDDLQLAPRLRTRLEYNLHVASGGHPGEQPSPRSLRMPTKQSAMPAADLVAAYLGGTPFEELLLTQLPLTIPEEVRFEHMHVLAGTGHGKTQLLQHLIASDLQRDPDDIPSMVILDSQGDMINALKRLALFDPHRPGSLASRLLIVDPSDVAFPPSLNLFDVHSDRLEHYTQRDREQVLAGIIEIYDYIFGGLLGAELTQKQSMVFRFLAQLMLSIPGATIHTLRELLEDATPYMPAVEALPPTARGFFENHFFGQPYKATRDQILRRLYGVLQNPSFERMFAQPENRLDLFDTLNNGGIVLVNTAKDFLKSEASSIFGRYIIALTLKAAFERATLPRAQRRPTFLWIDEASEYFDDNIDNLLIQARKFNLGLVMAHQYLGQLSRNLPASLMTNTSIKLVGGVSDRDARAMASEMRTTAELLNSMTKSSKSTNFAAFARNHTPHALQLTVPFGTAENLDQMPEMSFEALLAMSRERLASKPVCQTVEESGERPEASEQAESPPPETRSNDDVFDDPYD